MYCASAFATVSFEPLLTVLKISLVLMALGLTGQFSWQTMQGLSMAHGRQRPRSMKAVPILIGP